MHNSPAKIEEPVCGSMVIFESGGCARTKGGKKNAHTKIQSGLWLPRAV